MRHWAYLLATYLSDQLPRRPLLRGWVNRGKEKGKGPERVPRPTAKIGPAGCGALPMSNLRSASVSLLGVLGADNASYSALLVYR